MHIRRRVLIVGLTLAGFGIGLFAQNPDAIPPAFEKPTENAEKTEEAEHTSDLDAFDLDAPKLVQVQVEFVEMSHETLTKLLFMAKPGNANASKLRQQVQDMVPKNEAKVLETQILCARSGQKSTAEAIHEFIYPTEYTAAVMPNSDPKQPLPSAPVNSGTPTAFETRNLGSTIEVEPTAGTVDDYVDLRFVPELTWHTGNTVWQEGKDKAGNPFKYEMPNFYTLRIDTQLSCKDGQYTLAGTLSPKDAKGEIDMNRKVMVFVKCDMLTVQ